MKNNINLFDTIVYFLFLLLFVFDFILSLNENLSLSVCVTFLFIAIVSYLGFIFDKGFLTINKIIYIFIFLFCYFAPFHQYIKDVNIHSYDMFWDSEYLKANLLIIMFSIIYMLSKIIVKSKKNIIKNRNIVYFTKNTFILFIFLSLISFIFLYLNNELLSFTNIVNDNTDSFNKTIIKIVRFFPISALMLYIFAKKNSLIKANKVTERICISIISIIAAIIFFPLNGTINRFLLFGTYLMLLSCYFEDSKYKSIILIFAIIGFYYIFPAFNFFKYHKLNEISTFVLGGFDSSSIDYDAYQLFMQTIRYTDEYGISYGKNILSALLSFIPRSIWHGKSLPSGQLVSSAAGASFTNVSCPIFAEFYLAFKTSGIIILTVVFSKLIKFIERGNQNNNIYIKGLYCISVGIMISFLRGAMLPVMSFWLALIISYTIVYYLCLFSNKKNKEIIYEC